MSVTSLFSLENRTALVTGGTRGIGAQMAIALAEAGADIVLVQRDTKNQQTKQTIESLGRKATIYTADLSRRSAVSGISKTILADGHDISILVTCAGIQRRHPAEIFPDTDWDEVLQVNLTTVFTLCRDIGAYMLTRPVFPGTESSSSPSGGYRGSIINVASLVSFQGGITVPAYAAAKGGIAQLTKALSNEWASKGVNVNAIAPGYIATDMNEALIKNPERARQILERIPAGRWGNAEDFKGPTVFLAGRASSYVSGEILTVDGGWMVKMVGFDMRGLTPAPVTPFTESGEVDYAAIQRLGSWLSSIGGVKGLVVLGHAGEGTFLTPNEQVEVIKAFVKSVNDKIPIIAGITGEGTEVAALEAKRAKEAGARAGLLYPSHGWLRFGYQDNAPQDRYRRVYEVSGLPLILFQYPDNTKATYSLKTMLDIAAQPGVFAMKNGVRNMRRWDTEIPVIRRERPDLQILSCHDEYLLHTAFDVDGFLVGYGNIAPEPLIEMIEAGKAQDYKKARAIHDQLLPVTKSVYHRGSHMEGTVALKHALVARGILSHATVRSPLMPLPPGADQEIHDAMTAAALSKVV